MIILNTKTRNPPTSVPPTTRAISTNEPSWGRSSPSSTMYSPTALKLGGLKPLST